MSGQKKQSKKSRPRNRSSTHLGSLHNGPQTGSDVRVVRGSVLWQSNAASATGVSDTLLFPQTFGTQLTAIADTYLEYRFLEIRFTVREIQSASTVFVAINCPLLNTVPTAGDVCQMENCWYNPPGLTCKDWHVWKRRHLLATPLKWWRYAPAGGTDDDFEYQGSITADGLTATTGRVTCFAEYVCEFRNLVPTEVTTARITERVRRSLIEEADEKDDVVHVSSKTQPYAAPIPVPSSASVLSSARRSKSSTP